MNTLNEQDLIKENNLIVELVLKKINSMQDGERVVLAELTKNIANEVCADSDCIEGVVFYVLHRLQGLKNCAGRNGGTFKSFRPESIRKKSKKQLSKELQEAVDNARKRTLQIISE